MGFALHVCVESTLRAAYDLGYESIVIDANEETKKTYKEQYEAISDNFQKCAKKANASIIELSTEKPYESTLKAFFDHRRKRRG